MKRTEANSRVLPFYSADELARMGAAVRLGEILVEIRQIKKWMRAERRWERGAVRVEPRRRSLRLVKA